MLLYVSLIMLIVGIALYILYQNDMEWFYDKHYKLYKFIDRTLEGWFGFLIMFMTVVAGLIVFVSLIIFTANGIERNLMYGQYNERYKAITYKVESGACRDELGLLSKEVIDEVQEWNEEIITAQIGSENPWIGIYYKDFWDEFDTIDYDRYNINVNINTNNNKMEE